MSCPARWRAVSPCAQTTSATVAVIAAPVSSAVTRTGRRIAGQPPPRTNAARVGSVAAIPTATSTLAPAAISTSTSNAVAGRARLAAGVTFCQCSEAFCTPAQATTNSAHAHRTSSEPPRTCSFGAAPLSGHTPRSRSRPPASTTSSWTRHATRPPPLDSTISASSSSP